MNTFRTSVSQLGLEGHSGQCILIEWLFRQRPLCVQDQQLSSGRGNLLLRRGWRCENRGSERGDGGCGKAAEIECGILLYAEADYLKRAAYRSDGRKMMAGGDRRLDPSEMMMRSSVAEFPASNKGHFDLE